MGAKDSSEAKGVNCQFCRRNLPKNAWNFENERGWYIFYNKGADGVPYYVYARRTGNGKYSCMPCLKEGKDGSKAFREIEGLIAGKGMIFLDE